MNALFTIGQTMNSLDYRKIFRGLATIGILIIFLLPHLVFELVTEAGHVVLELIVELGHIVFEWVEISLDTVIELLFETELHDTQIIVFYIIMAVVCFALYRLALLIPRWLRRLYNRLVAYYFGQKNRLSLYWQSLSLLNKIKMAAIGIGVSVGYLYVFFSF
jgi:hypothetical protein